MSGSPILNDSGRAIGVITRRRPLGSWQTRKGKSGENVRPSALAFIEKLRF